MLEVKLLRTPAMRQLGHHKLDNFHVRADDDRDTIIVELYMLIGCHGFRHCYLRSVDYRFAQWASLLFVPSFFADGPLDLRLLNLQPWFSLAPMVSLAEGSYSMRGKERWAKSKEFGFNKNGFL